MQSITWSKRLIWVGLVAWPWLVWAVAKSSPEMILKGIGNAGSLWMPVFLDCLICMGWHYAMRSRRSLVARSFKPFQKSAIHGPHFKIAAQRQKSKSPGESV